MERIEINVKTGEKKVIQLTPAEEAAALAEQAAHDAKPKPPSYGIQIVEAITGDPLALAALKNALK